MAIERLLRPIADVRKEETSGVLLMFSYSFLAMTAYNIVQPITRSRFIAALGAENLPYVLLVSVFIIALIMQGYSKLGGLMPARWIIPATQLGMVGLLLAFWTMFGRGAWVEVGFYLFGQFYGLLLISQFWTLANLIFDPRQAKRVFGFIGGGASLGGIVGGSITAFLAQQFGNRQLVLVSAVVLAACAAVVVVITRQTRSEELRGLEDAGKEEGVGGQEALRMLRQSKHLQIIAGVIALTSLAAGIVDQQLNMATEAFKGADGTDAMAQVLAQVQVWVSAIGFVIQVWLTSRIQRYLGVGFALLLLPVSFSATAVGILLFPVLNAAVAARIVDKSLRYTVDKTTREILFLPLPADIKAKAKPFVDVTVDRFARAVVALLLLVLIAPWGLQFDWRRLSFASLGITLLWIAMAIVAKRGYIAAFRSSIDRRDVSADEVRLNVADLQTVETLIEELADPDEQRVLYAIDILESLDKRNLITPLLLYHESPRVRARALQAVGATRPELAQRWLPHVQRLLGDGDATVRVAAVSALANIREESVVDIVRPFLDEPDGRLATSAAVVLARNGSAADLQAAEATLERLAASPDPATRRDVAAAIRKDVDKSLHPVLLPLLYDEDVSVAEEALRSVRSFGTADFLFVPTLVALLRNRRLKGEAREVLASYGSDVVPALAHFLRDQDEDIWVRRHIPGTLARIPSQQTVDTLVSALGQEPDGFLRYKLLTAIDRVHRQQPDLTIDPKPLETLLLTQATNYFNWLSLRHNLFEREKLPADSLLARALREKTDRAVSRIYVLLGILYPRQDIEAARWAIERGDAKARAAALEYLDNLLAGPVRKRILPVIEDAPLDEKVRKGNALLSIRPRDVEETLLQLINDDDQMVAATAIQLAAQQRLWSLAPDIEHVLAHRDPRDWFVFEAASWALAEQRMPPERVRQLWAEPLPAVELAARLRTLPIFADVSVDELFRLGGTGRQNRYEAGHVLGSEGQVPDTLQFLLEGTVEGTTAAGDAVREFEPVAPLGFDEVVTGTASPWSLRSKTRAVCLDLTVDQVRTLLADNADFVQGLFRTVLDHTAFGQDRFVLEGTPEAAAELGRLTSEGLTPVEKLLALQSIGPFSRISADELLHLANATQRVAFNEGQTLARAAQVGDALVVISGELALSADGAPPLTAKAGDVVGLFETLAGVPVGRDIKATTAGIMLRLGHHELFEVLGERPALLRQLFAQLLGGQRRAEEVAA